MGLKQLASKQIVPGHTEGTTAPFSFVGSLFATRDFHRSNRGLVTGQIAGNDPLVSHGC
jgi:hypothetical protein